MAALSEIEKLEARFRENPEGRYFAPLADAYRKAGRVDDALMLVQAGLERHPDYLSAHIVLGRCHLDKKDDGAALAAFQQVLTIDAENIIALKSLAEISERIGNALDARRWLMRLLAVDSMNTEAEEDLHRLGGPVEEAAAAEAPAAEAVEGAPAGFSFADVVPPEAPTEPVPAIPEALVAALPEPEIEPEPAPAMAEIPTLEMEPVRFAPPTEPVAPAAAEGELVPFDDQLAWGVGERQSAAIRREDIEAVHHEDAVSPAFEFLTAPPEEHVPATAEHPVLATPEPAEAWEAAPEVAGADVGAAAMPPVAPVPEAQAAGGLPLIMPEDVTPAEELTRPSAKMLQMVSPETPAEAPAEAPGEPLLTETVGDLYLKQGFRSEAAEVYRRLLAQRPDDAGLRAKLARVETPPRLSAQALGVESVGVWLRRVARASLSARAPEALPEPPTEGPTPMESAFSTPEPEPVPAPPPEVPGEPARPATDAFSLDQIFGAEGGAPTAAAPAPAPAPPLTPKLGATFDEFFGGAPEGESVRPQPAESQAPSDDDLSAFNAWLHGLKR